MPIAAVVVELPCETNMAAIASFKSMFRPLGFSEDAAVQLSSDYTEGLSSIETVKALTDDRVCAVCKAVFDAPVGLQRGMPCD